MTIQELNALLASGEFHHATYRNIGNLWEGLYIYRHDPKGFDGFAIAGVFNKRMDADTIDEAHNIVRHTGVSVGSRGNG